MQALCQVTDYSRCWWGLPGSSPSTPPCRPCAVHPAPCAARSTATAACTSQLKTRGLRSSPRTRLSPTRRLRGTCARRWLGSCCWAPLVAPSWSTTSSTAWRATATSSSRRTHGCACARTLPTCRGARMLSSSTTPTWRLSGRCRRGTTARCPMATAVTTTEQLTAAA